MEKESGLEIPREKQEEFLLDALAGVEEKTECEHTPDQLDFVDWEHKGDSVEHIFQCNCGKTVTETFTYSRKRVL